MYELTRCAVCGGADATVLADADAIRHEAELLWAFHSRRLSARTPPGRLVDRVAFSQDRPWRVVRCTACGLVYRNPAEHRDELTSMYARAAPEPESLSALQRALERVAAAQVRRLTLALGRRGSGLEIGSYVGAFLLAARAARWQFEGLDLNPQVNAFTRSLGVTVHDGDLTSFRPDRVFDAVAIWNTFDQLPDPAGALRAAAKLLRPGGVLALRVPNGACYATWRSRLADGGLTTGMATAILAHNNLLTFPYRFGFTPAALGSLLDRCGFSVLRVVPDVLVPTADEFTRRWAALEERLVKPLTRRWTPWFEVYATVPA